MICSAPQEFLSYLVLGLVMICSGAYLQWLVLVFNEDPQRLSLSLLPEKVRTRMGYALVLYVVTSIALTLLVLGFMAK